VNAVPDGVRSAASSTARRVVSAVGDAARAWPLLLLVAVLVATWSLLRRRRRRRTPPVDTIAAAHEELMAALEAMGHAPDPSRTPAEVLESVSEDASLGSEAVDHVTVVLRSVERARFARPGDRPSEAEATRALAAAVRVRELARHR
jgi:hypothetical protein